MMQNNGIIHLNDKLLLKLRLQFSIVSCHESFCFTVGLHDIHIVYTLTVTLTHVQLFYYALF